MHIYTNTLKHIRIYAPRHNRTRNMRLGAHSHTIFIYTDTHRHTLSHTLSSSVADQKRYQKHQYYEH